MIDPERIEVLATADPERFTVLLGDGRVATATLANHTRRGLHLHGVPPVHVARELVTMIVEQDRWPESDDEVVLAAVAGAMPGSFTEELRSRLT